MPEDEWGTSRQLDAARAYNVHLNAKWNAQLATMAVRILDSNLAKEQDRRAKHGTYKPVDPFTNKIGMANLANGLGWFEGGENA